NESLDFMTTWSITNQPRSKPTWFSRENYITSQPWLTLFLTFQSIYHRHPSFRHLQLIHLDMLIVLVLNQGRKSSANWLHHMFRLKNKNSHLEPFPHLPKKDLQVEVHLLPMLPLRLVF